MPSDEFEVPREVAEYALLERLARARTGSVHKGKHADGHFVAVRFPADRQGAPSGSRKTADTLSEVSRLLEKVRHPVIPRLLHRGTHEDRPFAVFELVTGERLDKILEDQRLSVAAVIDLGRNLARALAEAHRSGVVHGDVCPRSIYLSGGGGVVHLLGWGAARPAGAPLHKEVPRASLPPPEVEGNPTAPAVPTLDVHGVGAVLYEALAFAVPRPRKAELPAALRDPLPIRALNPTVPPLLEAVVLKALEPEPSRRYASADELAAELDLLAAGKTPRARPAGAGRALVQLVRRRPLTSASISLLLATLLAVSGTSSVMARARSDHARADLVAFDTQLARGDVPAARAALERARRLDADSPGVARAQARLADLDAAERESGGSVAVELARALASGRSALERARARARDLPELAAALQRAALEARPLDPLLGPEKQALLAARSTLEAAARERAEHLGEAEAAFRRALRLAPTDPEPRRALAEVRLELALPLEADRELEREDAARERRVAEVLTGAGLAPASLVVEVEPAGVLLEVQRESSKPVPVTAGEPASLPPGDVVVVATKPDFRREEVAVALVPGGTARLKLKLLRESVLTAASRGLEMVLVPATSLRLPPAPAPLAGEDVALAARSTAAAASSPVSIAAVLVAKAPVTRGQYARFLRSLEPAARAEHLPRDVSGAALWGETVEEIEARKDEPVAGVALASARACARSEGARLPTRAELWAARARGAEGALGELVDDEPEGAGSSARSGFVLVLDLHVVRGDRDVTGDERLARASLRSGDVTFRLARPAPESP